MTLSVVRSQYEDYPYPPRDPEEEGVLLHCSGESLPELSHWLYRGRQDYGGFRCLVAGGGTGDSTLFLAEQLRDKPGAEVVYLDFSRASMEVAQARAQKHGLRDRITWVNDSLLNLPHLNLGQFDFIQCTGVLHHLRSPSEGLRCLADSLTDTGGMDIMVYGQYGRTGVYQLQDLLRLVNEGVSSRAEEVMNAKLILRDLPPSNWFVRGEDLITDHKTFGDAGIYDLLLHKQDRAFTVPQLYELVEESGLHFVAFSTCDGRLRMDLRNLITDVSLLQRLLKKDLRTQQAAAELLLGNFIKHQFYVSRRADSVASFSDLENVPHFTQKEIPSQMCSILEKYSREGGTISFTLEGLPKVSFRPGPYSLRIFKALDGEPGRPLRSVFVSLRELLGENLPDEVLVREVQRALNPFVQAGVLVLLKDGG